MCVQSWGNSLGLYFAAQTGCLVDSHSLAAAYGKNDLKRPVLGSLLIRDGVPMMIPMVVNKRRRWTKALP
jgi:hypothetical protein